MDLDQGRITRSKLLKAVKEDPTKEAAFSEAWKKNCSTDSTKTKTPKQKKTKSSAGESCSRNPELNLENSKDSTSDDKIAVDPE